VKLVKINNKKKKKEKKKEKKKTEEQKNHSIAWKPLCFGEKCSIFVHSEIWIQELRSQSPVCDIFYDFPWNLRQFSHYKVTNCKRRIPIDQKKKKKGKGKGKGKEEKEKEKEKEKEEEEEEEKENQKK